MIVIINSIDFPLIPGIVQALAGRYEAGAGSDLQTFTTERTTLAMTLEEIGSNVSSRKQHGKQHIVLSGTFHTVHSLKQLRVYLDQFDNEIYAFRLHFRPAILTQLNDKQFSAYTIWNKQQQIGAQIGDMGYAMLFDLFDQETIVNAIWDDVHEPIELVEYNHRWPKMFASEHAQIRNILGKLVIDIEHIGSTAISGMVAKPVIDILLTVQQFAQAWKCIDPLRTLGYAFIDYPQNRTRLFFRKGQPRSHHLHIVEKGSASDLNHIHFRDALLTDKVLRAEYLQLKCAALEKYKHRRALYGERKGKLIQKALAKFRES